MTKPTFAKVMISLDGVKFTRVGGLIYTREGIWTGWTGGFSPSLKRYYLANHLTWVVDYLDNENVPVTVTSETEVTKGRTLIKGLDVE